VTSTKPCNGLYYGIKEFVKLVSVLVKGITQHAERKMHLHGVTKMRISFTFSSHKNVFVAGPKMVSQHRDLSRVQADNLGSFKRRCFSFECYICDSERLKVSEAVD
jgi:hypothetical protein